MAKKNALKINLDELCSAMENSSFEFEHYLDLETGEMMLLTEYMDNDEGKKLRAKIEDKIDRHEPIPKADSDEGYEDMQNFIAAVKDEHLSELLVVAINGKGAFRRFKDVLLNHPEERWLKFSNDRVKERVLSWLDDIDVSLIKE